MKKFVYFISGTLVGAVIMTAGSAIAAEVKQLVGTKVGSVWELHVDGKVVGEVPIINGNSYGPVRQIAEIAGMDVEFEKGKVFLETREALKNVDAEKPSAEYLSLRINFYNGLIKNLEHNKEISEENRSKLTTVASIKELDEHIAELNTTIAEYEAEIAKLEAALEATQ